MTTDGGEAEGLERARFIAAAHHELNTPLAIIRGWIETIDDLWEELDEADRRRGIAAVRRTFGELVTLLDALFTDVRADALTGAIPTGTSDVDATLAALDGRQGIDRTERSVEPGLRVEIDRTVLETLLLQIVAAVATYDRNPRVEAYRRENDVAIEVRGTGELPADPFEAFQEERLSIAGVRLRSARHLAEGTGAEVSAAQDGDDVVVTLRVR